MLMANGTVNTKDQKKQKADSQALVKVAELLGHSTKDFANLAMKAYADSGGAGERTRLLSTGGWCFASSPRGKKMLLRLLTTALVCITAVVFSV